MFMYVFSIFLVVISNIVYHICQKSTPAKANPFAALLVTYLTASVITLIIFLFSRPEKGLIQSFRELNWTSFALGLAIVGLEAGFLMAYRAGWNISIGSMVANIIVSLALIPVGILLFKEGFELTKVAGAVFCIIGLVLINR
jgi:drug/metabolite transporter (DMT)-like permease